MIPLDFRLRPHTVAVPANVITTPAGNNTNNNDDDNNDPFVLRV